MCNSFDFCNLYRVTIHVGRSQMSEGFPHWLFLCKNCREFLRTRTANFLPLLFHCNRAIVARHFQISNAMNWHVSARTGKLHCTFPVVRSELFGSGQFLLRKLCPRLKLNTEFGDGNLPLNG